MSRGDRKRYRYRVEGQKGTSERKWSEKGYERVPEKIINTAQEEKQSLMD